jgi:orotidine-5'-phosphate decarboxylase
MSFGARLHAAMARHGPLCAGIDPHGPLLRAWGYDDDLAGLERFAMTAVDALAPYVAAVKPQSAFFERFGSRGVAVLERAVVAARAAGTQVILDVKRGDIGSTSQAYADAYLDQSSPLAVDAITASPYLGFGSLQPMYDTARQHGAGVIVLALTSNPEGPQVQQARTPNGTVAGGVLAGLAELNRGATPLGSFGAVVGATIGSTAEDLAINGPLLVPGFGAQGGTAQDIRRLFGSVLGAVVPSSSREILSAGPDPTALRDAASRTNDDLRTLLGSV